MVTSFVYYIIGFAALGGFLFGYDTGVVSGAMVVISEYFYLSSSQQESVVSITVATAIIGSLAGGPIADKWGRRPALLLGAVVFVISALILAWAHSYLWLLIGRFLVGLAVGLSAMVIPLYLAECTPPSFRGRAVAVNNLCINCGQFCAALICAVIAQTVGTDSATSTAQNNSWRYMVGIGAIPALIMTPGLLLVLPETPKWLIRVGRKSQAIRIWEKINGTQAPQLHPHRAPPPQMDLDMQLDLQQDDELHRLMPATPQNFKVTDRHDHGQDHEDRGLGGGPDARGTSAGAEQIDDILDEDPMIQDLSNESSSSSALASSQTSQARNALHAFFTDPAIRSSLALGCFIQFLQQAIGINTVMYYAGTIIKLTGVSAQTAIWSNAFVASFNFAFGFIGVHLIDRSGRRPLALTSLAGVVTSLFGLALTLNPAVIANHRFKFAPVIAMCTYLAFFAIGMGPIPWTVNSELYPMHVRSTAISISTFTNWVTNYFVSACFLTMVDQLGMTITFSIYGVIGVVGWFALYLWMPETMGVPLGG